MLFINFLCLLYLMVHVDSHTISKSIDNDERVDDIFDSITDLERTRAPKLRRDRFQPKYRLDNKDEFVRPEYVFKDTRLYADPDKTTQKTTSKCTSDHSKHHKSPKRRVGGFWRKFRGKDKKNKNDNISRKRRIPKYRDGTTRRPEIALYHTAPLKIKRKNKNVFTPRPPAGKHVKREAVTLITETVSSSEPATTTEPVPTTDSAPTSLPAIPIESVSTYDPYSMNPTYKLRIGLTPQFENMLKNKFKIKTDKTTERQKTPEVAVSSPLETLSTQLAHLKEKYGFINKASSNSFAASESRHRTEPMTRKTTTTTAEPDFGGTMQIEQILNDIKMKAMAKIPQQNPMVTDIITNAVTEATFESDPVLIHLSLSGYEKDDVDDISTPTAKRDMSPEDLSSSLDDMYLDDSTTVTNTESHYIAARSLKEDTITMAHNVEDMLQRELKNIYNKVKHKVSSDFRKEINKAKSTIKEGINKISSTCKPCNSNSSNANTTTKPTLAAAKAKFTQSTKPVSESTKEKATSRHARDTPAVRNRTSEKAELEFTRPTYDDYVMLTLYEEMLAKTHEDNVRKMLATSDITPLKKKRRHHIKMSKRSPENMTDVELREDVASLYEDASNMPEYDYVDPVEGGNVTSRPPENPDSDNESLEPVTVPDSIMSEPEQHIHNAVSSASSSATDLSDTSLEGLSNKISYNDFVNGYRHYLKFQKEQGHQNFSNLVKYQAHRHHSVDDIGKFILNKIPKMPSRRRKRFLDETDMDYQEITTKSDDSWFKKHFYLFIDNGPPKKFHTSQTVELKSAATAESKAFVTEPLPRLTQKNPIYLRMGSEEPGRTTQDTSSMNLEDLSKVLDSIKSKQTLNPYYKGYKPKNKGFVTTPNITITEDGVVQIRMMPQNFIGRLFGGKRRQANPKRNLDPSDALLPYAKYTENPMYRVKRTAKIGSVSIIDDFKDLEEKPTTALKEVFGEPGLKTRETNKYGYVDIDLVPRQTAVVKLRENPKKSRLKNFFKKFHFRRRKKTKPKHNKRSCYYGNENYGYPPRRSRFNPLKKLKDMFRMKSEPGKEGGPGDSNAGNPDYDVMTSHIDAFKPVKYGKPISVEEMQRQIPNISDLLTDSLTSKRTTTAHTHYHFRLDDSDRALLNHYPSTSDPGQVLDHTPQNEPVNPQVLAKKDLLTTSTPSKKTVATTKPATQATTSIRPTESSKTKSTSQSTKPYKKQKTTTLLRQPPNNVMTVNVKTLRPLKTKPTTNPSGITQITKRTSPTPTATTSSTTRTTTPKTTTSTTESTYLFRAEPSQLFRTANIDIFETETTDVFTTEAPGMMSLDDINLILNNIQSKLHKFTSSTTEFPKLSTAHFKRGTLYAKKHKAIQIPVQRPNEIQELSVKSKLTRIAKFPITKRQFKMKNLNDIPVHDESEYPGVHGGGAKGYRHNLGNRHPSKDMKTAGKITKFYSALTTMQPGGRQYTDYFNDLVMWHNDILNLDKVPSPIWKDILQNVHSTGLEAFTTPNMTKLMMELEEMNIHLTTGEPSLEWNSSIALDPYLKLAYKDVRKYPNVNKQGVIRSLAMDDNTIVTSKDLLIKGEAKYYQYNKPSEVIQKIKSSDFISKLNNLKGQDDEKVDIGDLRRSDPTLFFETKEPAILVDTSLMAYDDDADSVTSGLEIKKLSRDSQKSNKAAKKQYTPFLKTNKAPMQYFTTPLPMKSTEFNKFLKENKMDVESVTSPTLELPTFREEWTTKPTKRPTSAVRKLQAYVTKEKLRNQQQIEKLKKMNSDLMKSINYTNQLMMKVTPPTRPEAKGKKDSYKDHFDRHKRYSEISKTPRLASVKAVNQKATQEDNYYNILKTKLKERLFEKKGTPTEERVTTSPPSTVDPRNKEVEITIINFDDIEKLNNTQPIETFALPMLKTTDENINVNIQYTTELTEKSEMTTTTTTPTQTITEYVPKLDLVTKDEMHNGLLYKDIFKERDKTTTSTTEFTTMDNGSTTEYVDPSINDTPTTTVNKIRYPFEKIPQMYPSLLGKMPRVKDFNSPPKRVHISSHHYKYDIFYDDNKKIVKPGFQFRTKAPMETMQVGTQKRSQLRENVVVLRHPGSPIRAKNVIHATSLGYGKRSKLNDNLRTPAIFRKGEAKVEVIKTIDRPAQRNRHARKVSDTEVTRRHRLFTWRGCKPKPEGGLSAPGENPEDKATSKEPSTSLEPSTASFATVQPDVTMLSDVTTPNDVTMAAVTDSLSTTSVVLSTSSLTSASISSVTSSMTDSTTTEVSAHGSLVYDLKQLRRTTPNADKDKIKDKDKDRHRRLFNLSSLIHDKFRSIMRNLTTAKRAVTTLAATNQSTNAVSKRESAQTTRLRSKKKEKEVEADDSKDEGLCITCGPTIPTEHKNASCGTATNATTNATTTTTAKSIEPCKEAPHKAVTCPEPPPEPVYVEPDLYSDQVYYESGPEHEPPTPPPAPTCSPESDAVGKHMKRDLQTQQNTFTARDVAALEVIVDLMKNTLSYEDKDIASAFPTNNYIAGFPHATKSITSSNETTNAIQVHIAIPYDFQSGKKRSPIDPVRVRKVFSAKMSTPVDLEYQVHSFEGAVEPTTEHTAVTTAKITNSVTAHTSRVSVEGALSPGMYLLVDKPKTGLALKPIKGKINLSDLKTRQVSASASTASMSESKPTESREETKSIARVTLSKDFIAAFNQQLMQLYENTSQANHLSTHKQRVKRSGWKSRDIKAVTDSYANYEEQLFVCKRRIDWEAVKKYFGHDRVCNCKCKADKAMCKACAASDAVVDELIFEFDNIGQFMKDHCTEIQTFFWMNPSGGQKLRDSVSRIDKSLADYYKRVKGKCQGRTCKTFSSYIDKRQIVKTTRETQPDSVTHIINELSALADDLNKTVALQACFNKKLHEEGEKFVNSIYSCILRNKGIRRRSNSPSPHPKKLIKNVYSLDNINVNIICNPESATSPEPFEHTSSLAAHQDSTQHLNDPLVDYVLGEPKHKKRKGLRKLFPRKSKKKLFSYYVTEYTTKRPRLHFKRQVSDQMITPLISDGGGAFWYDYIKPSTNEPRVARDSRHDKSIEIAVVQKDQKGQPKIQKIMEKPKHPTPNTLFLTVKTTPTRTLREAETTVDYLSHNINQLLQLFGSLQDIESMNKNSNRSTMFINHTTSKLTDEQTKITHVGSTLETKSTKCVKKVKTKMHYKGEDPSTPSSATANAKAKAPMPSTSITTEHSEPGEQNETKQTEPTFKPESKEKQVGHNDKQSTQIEKPLEFKEKQCAMIEKPSEGEKKINKQVELREKLFHEKQKQAEQHKQAELRNKQTENELKEKQTEKYDAATNLDTLDTLEAEISAKPYLNSTPAPEVEKVPENINASDTIIIRDATKVLAREEKTSTTKTTKTLTTVTTIHTTKPTKTTTTTAKTEYVEPKLTLMDEAETTTATSSSFLGKLKTATLKFFDRVTQGPQQSQTTDTSTVTREIDKMSTTETDPMYVDNAPVTTRMSPTIVIINEYDNQINSDILEDPNKDANGYRNLLLSIIQYETNKLNDEWHRIAYGDRGREENGHKRSVHVTKLPVVSTTTKPQKRPKTKEQVVYADDMEYDLMDGMKALKHLELPEPTAKPRKQEGLLNKIVNRMGIKVVPSENKQAVKKPILREASRKKLNRKRRLKLNTWKRTSGPTVATATTEKACDSRRTPKTSQICDIQATVDHLAHLEKKVSPENFEAIVKNISCYKYKDVKKAFYIPYQRTGKRWDWIRSKRCLRLQAAGFHNDDDLDLDDQFDVVSFGDDTNDSFEKYVKGEDGIYKIINRKKRAANLRALDVGLRNIPPLTPSENEVFAMIGDSVIMACVPYVPIAAANKFHWHTDRKRMLNQDNVKVEGIKLIIRNVEPRNMGSYTCTMDQVVQKQVQLVVMTVPEFDVVFLPVYKTQEVCSYDDLKAIQNLGPLMAKESSCGKACSVRIDEPVCQRDRGTNSSLIRSTAVISMTPIHRVNCSLQCRRDIASSLVMLSATNTPYLANIAVVLSKDGVNETLKPWNHFVRPVVTHTLRKKDTNGHREYHKLVATLAPGKVDVVVNCPAGYYLLPEYKVCSSCPPNTSSKSGDNTCRSCPRGTRADPGASHCHAIKTPPRSGGGTPHVATWWLAAASLLAARCASSCL